MPMLGRQLAAAMFILALLAHPGLAASSPAPAGQAQPPITAQSPDETVSLRIGCIDLSFIATHSTYGKAASARLRERAQQAEAAIATRAKTLEAQQASLGTAGAEPDSAQRERQRAFEKGRLEFERFRQDTQGELTAFADELERELRVKLFPVVDTLAKEQGLHFVFTSDSPGLVWVSEAVDLSAEIVKRLDAGR